MVGVGTVIQDDPELTVRMVSGASPTRVVLDTTLRLPDDAKILGPDAATTVITTERSAPERREALRREGVRVEVVDEVDGQVSLPRPWPCSAAQGWNRCSSRAGRVSSRPSSPPGSSTA